MINRETYFKGRDVKFASAMTPQIEANSVIVILRANQLVARYALETGDSRDRGVNSGWRPPAVNATTPGAAGHSKHLDALAIDIEDDDDSLDAWCMTAEGMKAMGEIGLWLEHPSSTPRWCHVQIVSPHSGNRVFYP